MAFRNLAVRPGETIAIVGESGSGKSTLAAIIAGLYTPQAGEFLVDGKLVTDETRSGLRQNISIVFQDGGVFAGTIRRNICLGAPCLSQEAMERAATIAGAHDFITRLPGGYDHKLGAGAHTVSSGQRQRIAIARAIARGSAVLILDEATGNLDATTEKGILDRVLEVRRGKTTIIITHRLATAARAERILVLDRGAVVESGTDAELLESQGMYYGMWRSLLPYRTAASTAMDGIGFQVARQCEKAEMR
jgi:ABC-type multidrug transport system fused ATPase/permease subunit